jgi:tetratricopeptide (TPR) repeat protein
MINYKLSVAQLIKNKLIQRFILKIIIGVIVLILVFSDAVKAESLRSLIESGNRAYEQGDYVKSLDSYNKAAAAEPDSAIVQFNRGNALYKKGEYSDAFNVYEQAATRAMEENDSVLEAQSRYNMGNSSYRKAEVLSRENLEKALEEFNRSSEYYQSALNLDPGFSEAVQNLEVSRIAAKQVEELIRHRQQQAQQQQKAEEQIKKDLQELSDQQSDAAEQSKSAALEQQTSGQGTEAAQETDQLAERQKNITERTKSVNEKLEQLDNQSPPQLSDDMAQEHVKRALDRQEAAQKNLEQKRPGQASVDQQEAAQELQKALQQIEQSNEEDKKKKDSPEEAQGSENEDQEVQQSLKERNSEPSREVDSLKDEPESGESPEEIINEELENRKYRRIDGGTGYKAVEKDW